jgi:prepilin-type N-terminal cleavage/methylation domain-containing protein
MHKLFTKPELATDLCGYLVLARGLRQGHRPHQFLLSVNFPHPCPPRSHRAAGFSLTEVLVVMVVIGLLLVAVIGGLQGAGRAQRTGRDALMTTVDRARTSAISTQRQVLLAVAEPDDLPGSAGRLQLGLFELEDAPDLNGSVNAKQVGRWRALPRGLVLVGGEVNGLRNLLDEEQLNLTYKDGQSVVKVHGLGFNERGGLAWPAGSDPMALKLAEGTYVNGEAKVTSRGGSEAGVDAVRIGRVIARPWRVGT